MNYCGETVMSYSFTAQSSKTNNKSEDTSYTSIYMYNLSCYKSMYNNEMTTYMDRLVIYWIVLHNR